MEQEIHLKIINETSSNKKVFSEQVGILHHNLLASIPANLFCAIIVFISMYQVLPDLMLNWLGAVILVSALRIAGLCLYRRFPHKDKLYLFLFILGVILSSSLWGIMDSILIPSNNPEQQMIIMIVVAGVTAGGMQTLNANLKACLLYTILIIGPLCAWLFMQTNPAYLLLGSAMLAYLAFMLIASIRGYKLLSKALFLQFENQVLIQKLYEQSVHDPLTGLFNRRYLDETLTRELQRSIRGHQFLCVAMVDLDFFKNFNDTNGHEAGDEVLKFIGKLLTDTFRGSDISCRFGGEEFVVVLVNTTLASAVQRLEEFRNAAKKGKVYFHNQLLPPMTLSIGIAEAPEQGMTTKDIIHAADMALYAAKQAGRDRIVSSVTEEVI